MQNLKAMIMTFNSVQRAYEQACLFEFKGYMFKASSENLYGLNLGFPVDAAGYPVNVDLESGELHTLMRETLHSARSVYLRDIEIVRENVNSQVARTLAEFDSDCGEENVE